MAVSGICDIPGSPEISYTVNGGIAAVRTVLCPWASWSEYATELAPATIVIGDEVIQKPGAQFPHIRSLRVVGFNVTPYFDKNDRMTLEADPVTLVEDLPKYKYAKFVIQYGAPTSPQSGDASEGYDPVPFLEHKITSGGQLLDVSGEGLWQWYVADEPVDADSQRLPVMVSTSQHSVFWPRVINPNWPNLERFKGHVNDDDFTLRGYTYPAESLLYLNYDLQETVLTNASRAYNITLNFEGKRVRNEGWTAESVYDQYGGHNHYWYKDGGVWDKIVSVSDPDISPYPKADFTKLFKAAS